MKKYLTPMLICSTMILTACSMIYDGDHAIIQNRDSDYLSARSIPPLQIPPGLSSNTIHASYPVSAIDYPNQQKKISLIPPGLK